MTTLRKRVLVTTMGLAVSVFLSAGVSHASGGGSTVKWEFEADLVPCPLVIPNLSPCAGGTPPSLGADGTAETKWETRHRAGRPDESKGEFKGEVEIPVGDLGINKDSARFADVRMILSHADGTEFAECKLAFHKISRGEEQGMARYRVDVRVRNGLVRVKKGVCDVNVMNDDGTPAPSTAPGCPRPAVEAPCPPAAGSGPGNAILDSGVPEIHVEGDVVTATLVDPSEALKKPGDRLLDVDFLQGTLMDD